MDPIHPIAPGPAGVPRTAVPPVKRLERVSRERDRPAREDERRERREYPRPRGEREDGEDDGAQHIDVRV